MIAAVRMALALGLAAFGAMALFRVPHGALWKPAVFATEWGHLLVIAALALVIPWDRGRADAASWLAGVAAIALLTPLLRALPVAWTADARLSAAVGEPPRGVVPLGVPGLGRIRNHVAMRAFTLPAADGATQLPVQFYPASRAGAPLVVAVHGGSWNSGDPSQLPEIYHQLATAGWAVAAITYRLAPAFHHPIPSDDIAAMIAGLKARSAELAIDPSRLALYGRSAGGQLALLHAAKAHDPAIKAVMAAYPPTDFDWSWDHPTNPLVVDSFATITDYLGRRREDDPGLVVFRDASPWFQVGPDMPPTLLAHGGRDELVFAEQTRRFDARLTEKGVPHLLIELPWATHGFEANLTGPGGQLWSWAVDRWLRRWLPA
jgi:acetyl esterase/lipase